MDKSYKKSNDYPARWGFYLVNESLKGRVAMVALMVIIPLEILTKKTFMSFILSGMVLLHSYIKF